MYLPFILAAFALCLPQPGFAQVDVPYWITDSRTGCRVWNSYPHPPNEAVSWSGSCVNGMAQGPGVVQWFKDGKPSEGGHVEFRNGKMNGHGVYTAEDGSRYDGEMRNNMANGHGIATLANGSRYEGEYRDNKRNGRGLQTYANGDRYEGEWHDHKSNGAGKLTFVSGEVYNGFWTEGCFRDGNRRAALEVALSSCP